MAHLDPLQDLLTRAVEQETDILYHVALGDMPESALDGFNASYIGQVLLLFRQLAERTQEVVLLRAPIGERAAAELRRRVRG